MNSKNLYWMNYSIDISKEISQFGLVVGVVLVSEYNELICLAHSGEDGISLGILFF